MIIQLSNYDIHTKNAYVWLYIYERYQLLEDLIFSYRAQNQIISNCGPKFDFEISPILPESSIILVSNLLERFDLKQHFHVKIMDFCIAIVHNILCPDSKTLRVSFSKSTFHQSVLNDVINEIT